MVDVTATDSRTSLFQCRSFHGKRSSMHIDPLRLHHADVLPALWAVDIIPFPDGMITGDSRLPAVQQAAFPNLLVSEEFCPAG